MTEPVKKLGKLSLAILENFVEGVLGEKFVNELRQPTDREIAIASALGETEELFVAKFDDKDLSKALFVDLKQADRPVLKEAVGKYFDHPTDPTLRQSLQQILFEEFSSYLSKERIDKAVDFYLKLLTKELMLADETFRDNIAALAIVDSQLLQQRQVELLEKIADNVVSQQASAQKVFGDIHQISPPPADFTGREGLITDLLEDFKSHKGATISGLTGMGGIGKTALGLAVAHQIAKDYPDAQLILDLKGTTTPLSAMEIAQYVIVKLEPTFEVRNLDESNFPAAYQSALHGKKVLLFFDNARSAEQIAKLTPPESCAMLVTSRWNFTVAGLKTHKVGVMEENEAIDFLLELCPRIGDKASDLAKACGYLPLALRIAGSFLQVNTQWKVEKYLEELKSVKGRLETLKSSRLSAELTSEPDVLATFELSYNQLEESQKKNWRTLGVFSASFDASAAAAVWETETADAENLLGLLLRYSLVDFNETSSRYELHDLLAEYARSQMGNEEEQEARIKYASHYMEAMKKANSLYEQGNEYILFGLRLFDSEWEHILSAHAWITQNLDASEAVLNLAMLYPDASVYCLDLRLTPKQKVDWLNVAVIASRRLGRKDAEGVHLGNLGLAYAALGEARKAIDFYEQQLVIVREIGDRLGEGNALGSLGLAYAALGEARKAIDFHEQYREIAREIGDRRGEGNALGNLGSAYVALGEARKAIDFYEQALAIAREIGDRRGEGADLGNLGLAYADLGEARKAIDFYEQGLVIHREIGDRRGEGAILGNLGLAYAALGEERETIDFYEQALLIDREIGNRRGEALAGWNLGLTYEKIGEFEKAILAMQTCVDFEREIGHPDAEEDAKRVDEIRKKLQ